MLVIGDVHGKIDAYNAIVKDCGTKTVQIGDFGFQKHHDWHLKNLNSTTHKVLFGNHDFYPYLHKPHCLTSSFMKHPNLSLLFIRGAYSIDKHLRTEGIDWFDNEEISYSDFDLLLQLIEVWKPQVIVSHDCPKIVYEMFFDIHDKSRTNQGLQACFEVHQPELWIFGHHHKSKDEFINGTRFVCLRELEIFDLQSSKAQ